MLLLLLLLVVLSDSELEVCEDVSSSSLLEIDDDDDDDGAVDGAFARERVTRLPLLSGPLVQASLEQVLTPLIRALFWIGLAPSFIVSESKDCLDDLNLLVDITVWTGGEKQVIEFLGIKLEYLSRCGEVR